MDIAHSAQERQNKTRTLLWFRTATSRSSWRCLKTYVGARWENLTAIYYVTDTDLARLQASPQFEGFRDQGIEVLLARSG